MQSFHEQATRQGGRQHAVLRDVVAFANANGGSIYIGVAANPKVEPKGVENPEKDMAALRTEIERQVTPPLEVRTTVLKSRGRDVIRVEVPRGGDPPYALEGSKIYLRREAETNLAMRDELVDLIRRIVLGGGVVAQPVEKQAVATAQPAAGGRQQQQQHQQPRGRQQQPAQGRKQAEAGQGRGGQPRGEQPKAEQPKAEQPQPSNNGGRGGRKRGEVQGPRTGVEIVQSEERKGVIYHTMRDLRDGSEVHNVTRQSARRLWRYAIALKEKGAFQADKVNWVDGLGLWHKYLRAGKPHYDLVQKEEGGELRIYYGVSDEGIDGAWRTVVGLED